MGFYSVNPDRTALLFFDMLKAYYTDLDDAAKARTAPVVANCSLLNSVARAAGIPVVYTQADHRADGLDSAGLQDSRFELGRGMTVVIGAPGP